jgi:hypothetical protein
MRKILYGLTSFFFLAPFGLASTPAASYLTEAESQVLVREIDNICGDSWCSGDLNYGFDQLVCNSATCYFDIRAITRNDNGKNQSRSYRCPLPGFQKAADLLRVETTFDGQTRYTYTDKLYDAVGQCINEQIPSRHPVVYLPKASSCRESLRKQPRFKSAAHSVYAEIFYELENKAQASVKVLNEMIEQYASQDSNCSLQYHMAFEDQISCERVGGVSGICSLPTDLGRFIVIKDYVDSAAVLYIENTRKPSTLGTLQADSLKVKLAQPEACYPELLNLNGKQEAQTPFNSSDHHSYFVSAKNLNPLQDARRNAALLVNRAVAHVEKSSDGMCQSKIAEVTVTRDACTSLDGIPSCVLSGPNAGYYVVTGDKAGGAFVTFVRFD